MSVAEPLIQASLIGEALDRGPVLLFVADEHMRYVAVNAYACSELGYTREELLALSVPDVCRYPEAPEEYAEMMERHERSDVAIVTRKDGTSFRMRYRAAETRMAGLPYYVSVGWPE